MSVGSTSARSVQALGFDDSGRLTPRRRLYPLRVPRTSALPTASFRFSVAQDTLAVQLTLPLVGRVEDFHLQVSAPCRAHHTKPLLREEKGLLCFIALREELTVGNQRRLQLLFRFRLDLLIVANSFQNGFP